MKTFICLALALCSCGSVTRTAHSGDASAVPTAAPQQDPNSVAPDAFPAGTIVCDGAIRPDVTLHYQLDVLTDGSRAAAARFTDRAGKHDAAITYLPCSSYAATDQSHSRCLNGDVVLDAGGGLIWGAAILLTSTAHQEVDVTQTGGPAGSWMATLTTCIFTRY